ncbi:hypothetical protein [Pararhizobium sp. PWRC1-1]|uniref:hypothetical protein n=1 Tax=Pararhizobium sp. PWRC1-1 TaxID=2804566 RepID=UPI003CFA14D0
MAEYDENLNQLKIVFSAILLRSFDVAEQRAEPPPTAKPFRTMNSRKINKKQDIDECQYWRIAPASEDTRDTICLKIARLINPYFSNYTNSCSVHSNIRMFEHDAKCTSRETGMPFQRT